jgi:putative addiction module component (TIGR02574 family)
MAKPHFDFSHLTPAERVQLADELWESLADRTDALPLTETQAEELERRLQAYRKEPDAGIPWREALDEIENSGA